MMSALRAVLPVLVVACTTASSSIGTGQGDGQAPGDEGGQSSGDCPEFWNKLEIDANWVEYFPTLRELARGSDVVAFGSFSSAQMGAKVQGDAPEDTYTEILLSLAPTAQIWRGAPPKQIELTITPGKPGVNAAALAACLPNTPVLVFARKRKDRDAFRPVNGYGIWAKTPRAAVDTPLSPEPPNASPYRAELAGFASLDAFADAMRAYSSEP